SRSATVPGSCALSELPPRGRISRISGDAPRVVCNRGPAAIRQATIRWRREHGGKPDDYGPALGAGGDPVPAVASRGGRPHLPGLLHARPPDAGGPPLGTHRATGRLRQPGRPGGG